MKTIKTVFFLSYALACTYALNAMEEAKTKACAHDAISPAQLEAHKAIFITTMLNIKSLEERMATPGPDMMPALLGLYDFYESLRDPSYRITFPPSKKVLEDLALLDCYGVVHKGMRDAFRVFNPEVFERNPYALR